MENHFPDFGAGYLELNELISGLEVSVRSVGLKKKRGGVTNQLISSKLIN